jgi:tetratricopeptide (TPR) repeat protein
MSADLTSFQNDQKAAPVLASLKVEKWRKARDQAKVLCKKDRTRYLPLLIAANTGLYRAMLKKGLNKDAETVLAYLRTIAPADLCGDLAREQAEHGGPMANRDGSTRSGNADLWEKILQLAGALETGQPAKGEAWLCVDQAVIANQAPPDSLPEDARSPIIIELSAVQAALEATGEGRWEEARDSLKSISSRSIFQYWRLFLRGVRHWFCGELTQAQRCFLALPPEGACAHAAAVIAGRDSAPGNVTLPTGAHLAAWWLAVTGEDVRRARTLAEADVFWKRGSWKRAFELVKPRSEGFSGEDTQGLDSLWIDVFFPAGQPDSQLAERRLDETIRFLEKKSMSNSRSQRLLEWAERARILCDEGAIPAQELWTDWTTLLKFLDVDLGKNAIRNSVGYQWLGEQMARPEVFSPMFFGRNRRQLKDETRARKAFELAMKLDPQNEGVALDLLALFENTRKYSDRNRLLDELVKRFPDNKKILIRAGELATERRAFTKSADFFHRACVLDPLDPGARSGLAAALVGRARDYRKKGRSTGEIWETIEPLLSDHPARLPLMLSRWSMRVRRFLLDSDRAAASRALREAESLAPEAAERLFLERLLGKLYDVERREDWTADWKAISIPSWESFERLIDVVMFCSLMKEWKFSAGTDAGSLLLPAMRKLLKTGVFEKSPSAALRFVQRCRTLRRNGISSEYSEVRCLLGDILDAIGRKAERLTKGRAGNLHIRLAKFECRCEMSLIGFSDNLLGGLETLIDDAEAAGATDVAERAKQLRDERWPGAPWSVDQPEEEDDDDWDVFADPFDEADGKGPIDDIMMNLAAAIFSDNESAIEKLRENVLGSGVPAEEFEEMLNRASPSSKGSVGSGNRRKSGKSSRDDEAQAKFDFGET